MKPHSSFSIKNIIARDANRDVFEKIYATVTDGTIRPHILDIMVSITRGGPNMLSMVYEDNILVGCASYYCKNIGKFNSTCSLYNIFSLATGAGSAAFSAYWQYTFQNARWFKFYVFKKAHTFYNKRGIKYFGASKTGQTFSSFGRVYSNDVLTSMATWLVSYKTLTDNDLEYFETNYRVFVDKHMIGYKKVKDLYLTYLHDNLLEYTLTQQFDLSEFY